MSKILEHIARVTEGECFTSYKYCCDSVVNPSIEYGNDKTNYINLKDYAENVHDPKYRDLREHAKYVLQGPPLFKYFLDGSRRVYKVDDIQYDRKVFPIVSGQVSVACCAREINEDNTFKSFKHIEEKSYPLICLPVKANGEGIDDDVFFSNLRNNINELLQEENTCVQFEKVLYYYTKLKENETYEKKAIARIQDEMIECEKRIVSDLVRQKLLTQHNYLIKDGSIQYKPMKTGDFKDLARIQNNYRWVIGVSKKFNPNLMRDLKDQSSAGQIARLPLHHRTPAYLWRPGDEWGNVNYAIWYVRIRDIKKTESPYSGVIKVEKMLMTDKEAEEGLSTDEIDMISSNLINERNPVSYGKDARWANHLYPVYMTECYCKSRFMSDSYFMNLF